MTSGHFWIGLLDFFLLGCMSCLYILDINPLSVISFANVVSHSVGCLYEEIFKCIIIYLIAAFLHWASLVAQSVKNLPAVQETQVRSLGWEDPLEKEMAAHSSILAWKISWKRSLVGCSPWGRKELGTTERLTLPPLNYIAL